MVGVGVLSGGTVGLGVFNGGTVGIGDIVGNGVMVGNAKGVGVGPGVINCVAEFDWKWPRHIISAFTPDPIRGAGTIGALASVPAQP